MAQIPNIYRIDRQYRLFNGLTTSEQVIEKIIKTSFKKLSLSRDFDVENLKRITKDNVTYFLYLYNSDEIASDWEEFLPNGLKENENFIQQKISLILFIESETDFFCVIGGNAYQIIIPFLDHSFGLNTYAKIMKPELDELTSIKSRGITGARAGISEQFRDNYKIIDFIKFGKIPQEIHLKLSQEITDLHFKFLKSKNNERLQVSVGKAFKIKKEIDFDTLHKIILELKTISELAASEYLSSYKEIIDQDFIEKKLKPELIKRIFDDSSFVGKEQSDTMKRFEFDFCNPNNIEKFYQCDQYRIKEKTEGNGYAVFKTVTERSEIYGEVLSRAVERFGDNFFNFRAFIQGVRISCYQDEKLIISSNFIYHISTEFPISGNPIFLVDTKWYHIRDSFVNDLKTSTQHVLRTYRAPNSILDFAWNKETVKIEKDYNLKYKDRKNYIVIDTVIADGLELCDILYYDESNLYLIHVKYGFTSKIRELTNQITISARRLRDSLGTKDKKLLEKIYNQLIAKEHLSDGITSNDFKNLFDKKIIYVLGFTSHLADDLKVENNIDKFDSNIARFSLIQCSSEMRANYYDMLTYQIERD